MKRNAAELIMKSVEATIYASTDKNVKAVSILTHTAARLRPLAASSADSGDTRLANITITISDMYKSLAVGKEISYSKSKSILDYQICEIIGARTASSNAIACYHIAFNESISELRRHSIEDHIDQADKLSDLAQYYDDFDAMMISSTYEGIEALRKYRRYSEYPISRAEYKAVFTEQLNTMRNLLIDRIAEFL